MGLQVDPKELKKRQFFLEGNIPKAVLSVCLPMALFQLINELFRVFDLVITSQINPESVSAVSFFNQLNNSIVSVGTGLSIGAGILIAGLYGAGEYERLKTTVNTTFFMAGAAALVLVAGLILGARPILRLANTPAQLVEIGLNYYRITALNLFFTFFNNVYIAIEKARGNSDVVVILPPVAKVNGVWQYFIDNGYYVAPDLLHGAVALEEGVILDIFTPQRTDFL